MKKSILLFIVLICALTSMAQDNTLTFLGIPVDGSESNMIAKLKQKGFTYDAVNKVLKGKFNGRESHVFISTNYGKVDRIYVADADAMGEADIRIRYNNLVNQMNNNSKYFSLENDVISASEDISYEISVNNKRYEASYCLIPQITEEDQEAIRTRLETMKDQFEGKTEMEIQNTAAMEAMSYMLAKSTGSVWFMISKTFGRYYISMYYDNLNNRPNGEDL